MPNFNTEAAVVIQPIPDVCMYLAAPPVAFPILASDMNLDPDTAVQGRYVEGGDGQLQGVWAPLLQDTYITGSSGRTGRAFTVTSPAPSTNTWKDDFNDPLHDRYGLLKPNSSAGVVWEVRSTSITPLIEAADYIIKRGDPPAGNAGARVRTGYTCYVRFAYGSSDGTDYRVALEWGQPIRLDRTTDNGSTWYLGVAIARSLGNVERYMATHNGQVRLRVIPDEIRGIINIEIGDDGWLRHVSPTGSLPAPGNIDLAGQNGSVRFNYLPLRAQALSVQGNVDPIGTSHPNADNAFLVSNCLCSNVPDGQVDSLNVSVQPKRRWPVYYRHWHG